MATGHVLHPLAQKRLEDLQKALERDFGVEMSQRTLVTVAVHGATAAQLVGMQIAFVKERNAWEAAQAAVQAEAEEGPGGEPTA